MASLRLLRMSDHAAVVKDLRGAVERWRQFGIRAGPDSNLDAQADTALALTAGSAPGAPDASTTARFCIVTKSPHVRSPRTVACIAARLLAFGVVVHSVRRAPPDATRLVRTLYPTAARYFKARPTRRTLWERLRARFDNEDFATIFGRRFDPDLVMTGAQAMHDNGLSPAELTAIWETGRRPVERGTFAHRYGSRAATFVFAGHDRYDWFRGTKPVGIARIASGLTAFALRDERLNGGEPVVVLNGHVPGLATLFDADTWVFELGVRAAGVQIEDVRRGLTGDDSRPDRCRPGTLRRDAVDGVLRLDTEEDVTSRRNLVHCSDGLLAGLIEVSSLVPDPAASPDLLTRRLVAGGLTAEEIREIVLADPEIVTAASDDPLTERTRHLALADCVEEILRLVPPIFGAGNGYADGLRPDALARAARAFPRALAEPADLRPFPAVERLDDGAEAAGIAAITTGRVGMIAPVGGTGGRFGGYDKPESDPSRQKALRPEFLVAGRRVTSLDIRLANARHWSAGTPVPFAVMASPTNIEPVRAWASGLDHPIRIYQQHGVYRFDARLVAEDPGRSWVDLILREPDGRPSLKPPGALGLLTCFILSGMLEEWQRQGVEFVAVANGDDVGFRVDPRIVGRFCERPDLDIVMVGVPWGFAAIGDRDGEAVEVRGDESGWAVDVRGRPADGVPLSRVEYDTGGALCTADGRLTIVEGRHRPGMLFNTNHMYVRLASVRRVVDRTGAADPVEAVRRITDEQDLVVEDKPVLLGTERRVARQIARPLHGILQLLDTGEVVAAGRRLDQGQRGVYAPIKRPTDVAFGQLFLDRMSRIGDELVFPGPR